MSASYLERGLVLFQLGMFGRAEKEFLLELKENPDNALAHTMMAMCKVSVGKNEDALKSAAKALELDPALSYGHYALAVCYTKSHRPWLAMPPIIEALRLDPDAPEYWGLKAYLHLCQFSKLLPRHATAALECAETGLSCDPTDAQCMQMKVRALLVLNRKPEAFAALNEALALDPNDSQSHELRAWFALEGGKSQEAREFYTEALRLDPGSASARSGLLASMRAKHAIYRFLLKFMSVDGAVKFLPLLLIGAAPYAVAYLHKIPNSLCQALSLALIIPVVLFTLFALFAFFLANPIFNLILWLDSETRWSLTPDEVLAAKLLAVNLLIIALIVPLVAVSSVLWYFPLAMFGLLLAPTVIIFSFPPGTFRKLLYFYLAVNFLCAFVGSTMLFALDLLDATFKGSGELLIRVWASALTASIGMSICAFFFEALAVRVDVLMSKFPGHQR